MLNDVKIVKCQTIEGETLNYAILNDQQIGRGSFSTVKRAYEQSRQLQELAVKIIPAHGPQTKEVFNKQIQILKNLPDHPNLVKVIPVKCFSHNNFYIFMEFCNEGTLADKIQQKQKNNEAFTQYEIFQTFYQVLSGYEVLYNKKILHQDLKPENILIKNGIYKITDFGFSIFHQGLKLGKRRQGTMEYMPLEKLIRADYFTSPKSDIYAFGVIFYKMFVGRHPYVTGQCADDKEFIDQLRIASLRPPGYLRARMSIPMQHLFDIVLRMVAKKENQRIDFEDIQQFIKDEEAFLSFAQNQSYSEHMHSEQVQLPQKLKFRIVQYSQAFVIPFSIPFIQETKYEQILKMNHEKSQEQMKKDTINKIDRYLYSMRLMVYFFDRLSRKLKVEMMKQKLEQQKRNLVLKQQLQKQLSIQERAMLCLLYLSTKLTIQTLIDYRQNKIFQTNQWKVYKLSTTSIIQQIKKDEQYLKALTKQAIMQIQQSKAQQTHKLIQKSKRPLEEFMNGEVRETLIEMLQSKKDWLNFEDRKLLTTLNYTISAIQIIDSFGEKQQRWEQLEGFFREIETQELNMLGEKVEKGLKRLEIPYSIDSGAWE